MQLKATRKTKNLKEGSEISKNSCEVSNYSPKDMSLWDEAYFRFKKLVKI